MPECIARYAHTVSDRDELEPSVRYKITNTGHTTANNWLLQSFWVGLNNFFI